MASTIAAEQERHGHQTDIFVFDDVTKERFGGIMINYNSIREKWSFFRRLNRYDVWHYHYPYGSLKEKLEAKHGQRILLKHYHGDDLRGKYEKDFCLVSTPDLLEYAPKGKWLPNPIDLEEIGKVEVQKKSDNALPVIAHYPYYESMKSYEDPYSSVLDGLEKEGVCKVTRIREVPHYTALEMIAACDIVAGKIIPTMGWFSKFELEGMALGKPVIAYISDRLYSEYSPPIYRTSRETLKEDLMRLLTDDSERERLGKIGKEYVIKNHEAGIIANEIEKYYYQV